MKNKFFKYILLITALAVAFVAAYFSVFGISKLFAGAFTAAIVMATSLEIGKLILASYLYRVWNQISKLRRIYGVFAVAILMLITSVGIYGFLSNAFESTSLEVEMLDSQIEIVDTRIQSREDEKNRYVQLITDKQGRINTLTELRKSQEVRLDSLLANEHWVNARRTTTSILNADTEIQKMYNEIDELNVKLDSTNQLIIRLKTNRLDVQQNTDVSADVGPLRYISRLTNSTMDKVVNWVILLLIFVFDPLAIYLIISYNHLAMKKENELDVPSKPTKDESFEDEEFGPVDLTKEEPDVITSEMKKGIPGPESDLWKKEMLSKYKKFKDKSKEETKEEPPIKKKIFKGLKKKRKTTVDPKTDGIIFDNEEN